MTAPVTARTRTWAPRRAPVATLVLTLGLGWTLGACAPEQAPPATPQASESSTETAGTSATVTQGVRPSFNEARAKVITAKEGLAGVDVSGWPQGEMTVSQEAYKTMQALDGWSYTRSDDAAFQEDVAAAELLAAALATTAVRRPTQDVVSQEIADVIAAVDAVVEAYQE